MREKALRDAGDGAASPGRRTNPPVHPGVTEMGATLFGHPVGLYTLFFAEMWERFSYYGMRALLVFYLTKGFLGVGDAEAYGIYGAYTALVYATPYLGGMLADRLLGARRAVILGGMLMAAGHLLMTVEAPLALYGALALLVCGNGLFKPNISNLVGTLYPEAGAGSRDAGFTVFYMGVNLGAALAPLLCGFVGERYGWHYGFGLATAGMLAGLAVFVAPTRVAQGLILGGASMTAVAMFVVQSDASVVLQLVYGFVALALLASAAIASVALERGGLPPEAGEAPVPGPLAQRRIGFVRADVAVLAGIGAAVLLAMVAIQHHRAAGTGLILFGIVALGWIGRELYGCTPVERRRLGVILVLMFYSMSFWAFFEQAGSSLNNFADRNVDRVAEDRVIGMAEIGTTVRLSLTQEQLGHERQGRVVSVDDLERARRSGADVVDWEVSAADVGMGIDGTEVPASLFQAANPIFILILGLLFTAFWTWLGRRRLEPETPTKFAFGILQLGLGFAALWYGTRNADARGIVWVGWLLLGYLLQTTGELCLSPVGLSMVTRLAPARLVATMLGAWFLAMAFSNYLAAVIAAFTRVEGSGIGSDTIPPPIETVHVYGELFGTIACVAILCSLTCFAIAPLLRRWMHADAADFSDGGSPV